MATEKKVKRYRLRYLVLALVMAVMIWFWVAYATNTTITRTIHNMNVMYTGSTALHNNGLIIRSDMPTGDISVKLSGQRTDFLRLMDSIYVTADVSSITEPGEYDIEGTVKASVFEVVGRNIVSVHVVIDEFEKKEIPVKIEQSGGTEDSIVKSEPSLQYINAEGAKTELERIDGAYVSVDLTQSEGVFNCPIVLKDADGIPLTDLSDVKVDTATVRVTNTKYKKVELPVKAELAHNSEMNGITGYKVEPGTIAVGVADGYEFSDIKVEVKSPSPNGKEYELTAPKGMYIPSESSKVKVTTTTAADESAEESEEDYTNEN